MSPPSIENRCLIYYDHGQNEFLISLVIETLGVFPWIFVTGTIIVTRN